MLHNNGIASPLLIIILIVGLIFLLIKFKTFGKISGAILTIAGISSIAYGLVRANSAESQFIRAFGGTDEEMLTFLIIGGIATVVGIIFLIIGMSNNKAPVVHYQAPITKNKVINSVKVRCLKCQTLNEEEARFCGNCGETLMIEDKEA